MASVNCQSKYRVDYSSVYGNGETELPYPFFVEKDLREFGIVAEWVVYWGGRRDSGWWEGLLGCLAVLDVRYRRGVGERC